MCHSRAPGERVTVPLMAGSGPARLIRLSTADAYHSAAALGTWAGRDADGGAMEKVGVVGCGLMGAGIAEVCGRAGLDVVVVESSAAAVDAGWARLEKSLKR